ncbi:MAG: 16S rRNA (cytidine(1402)-2'-O)-methyltransferase [Hahellaceae bacterium]|nr:16S rRNA (cytidine(1402)-2'-O)-methyltransferase [Hahellaceae bacterium]
MAKGILFVVATPIGNLKDISARAIEVLSQADVIAAEDTRHTAQLLGHLGLRKNLISVHEHNEGDQVAPLRRLLDDGKRVALVSDAGTPLISDPGYRLVSALRAEGYEVTPVPGACALIAALSASGLPSDRFVFEGFLPAKTAGRRATLSLFVQESRTVIFYESTHRIKDALKDMQTVFGGARELVLARELTKTFETFFKGSIDQVSAFVDEDDNQCKGEFVLLLAGAVTESEPVDRVELAVDDLLKALLDQLPVKQAATLVARLSGVSKNDLYQRALTLKGE